MFLNIIFTILLLTSNVQAATPAQTSIAYNLFRNGTHIGVINETFEIKNGVYTASSEATATGLFALAQRGPIRYTSAGEITREGLRPLRFEGRRNNAVSTAEFDWKSGKLALTHNGVNQTLALPPATQDRLSAMYHLMHLVQNKARATNTVEFAMTNGRKLEHYRYQVAPDVIIDTPLKRLNTLHLVKQREPDDTQTEVWLAPEFHHLPVKLVIVESDGVRYEQVVTRLDFQL